MEALREGPGVAKLRAHHVGIHGGTQGPGVAKLRAHHVGIHGGTQGPGVAKLRAHHVGIHGGTQGPGVAKLRAHHVGILHAAEVIAHGTPRPVVEHLHHLHLVVPIAQSDSRGGDYGASIKFYKNFTCS